MAFNSESESMTIKRLEIALRKMDERLLKTAGIKLYEKYHSGHKFQYTFELQQILDYLENSNVDDGATEIICSTINQILKGNKDGEEQEIRREEIKNEEEEFILETNLPNMAPGIQNVQTSPISGLASNLSNTSNFSKIPDSSEITQITIQYQEQPQDEQPEEEIPKKDIFEAQQTLQTITNDANDVFIYYEEKDLTQILSAVTQYKKSIASNAQIDTTLRSLKEILNLLNSDLSNLGGVFSMFSNLKNKVSFATASMSAHMLTILKENSIDFEIPYESGTEGAWKFLPVFGNTAIFECQSCGYKILNDSNKSLIMQCEKCFEPAYPKLDSSNSLDGTILQNSFDALLNSKVWVLINPPIENGQMRNLFRLAYKNASPKRVYILSQDAQRKDYYSQMFSVNNRNCEIRTDFSTIDNFIEDFTKTEITTAQFARI